MPRTDGALAAKLQPAAQIHPREPSVSSRAADRTPGMERAVQGSLFQERPASNVIPFDSFAPAPGASPKPRPKAATGSKAVSKPTGPPDNARAGAPRQAGSSPGHPGEAAHSAHHRGSRHLLRGIGGDNSASRLGRRDRLDPVLIGYGLFLAAFWLGGGAFALTKPNLLVFGGALLLVGFTYGLLFAIAGTETAGMRCTRLQVMTFDGFPPDGGQRVLRFAARA